VVQVDIADLTARWTAAWGDCRPLGHELRGCLRDRWVRFHSLPGSRRYAEEQEEQAEVLRRHLIVLTELLAHEPGDAAEQILIITASWSAGPEPAGREPGLAELMAAVHWTSLLTDDTFPGEETWTHLWVSASRLHSDVLTRLLRLVADDQTAGVIITSAAMNWLYHPYDGGADVIAVTTGHRDQLRHRHQQWLSRQPSGL
jgi:hypothetical protein